MVSIWNTGRIFFIILLSINFNYAQEVVEQDGSILLPAQKTLEAYRTSKQAQLSASSEWQEFVKNNGSWAVQWNEKTGAPHRAYGQGIKIPGFADIHQQNIAAAASTFLQNHRQLLKLDVKNLKLSRAQKVNSKWYVTYRQYYENLEVLFSEIELRIHENGNVIAFGSDYYPVIEPPAEARLSPENAQDLATKYLPFSPYTDQSSTRPGLYLMPVDGETGYSMRPVYIVDVNVKNPVGVYNVVVDAGNGTIHWRHNRVRTIDTKINVSGEIHAEYPLIPEVTDVFEDMYIELDGVQMTTDSLGAAIRDLTAAATLTIRFTGPWVNMQRRNGAGSVFTTTVNPGDTLDFIWDDSNSFADERDVFYHTNRVHNFLKEMDPVFTGLDYSMGTVVNIGSEDPLWPCNAYWNGSNTNFFSAGGGCLNTGTMPSVIYHEYGHGVNDLLYQQAGANFGMINGATHEGIADVLSGMMEDVSIIGRGFFGTASGIRNMDNTKRFPDDITGSVHSDGEIIGGAFWDLRQNLGLEKATELFHFARYGTPDDASTGVAFGEWFLEVLIADDDDGDLSNGTPNFTDINAAFDAHGIGAGAFLTLAYAHTPFQDTQQITGDYPIEFELVGIAANGPGTEVFQVIYSTDNFSSETAVTATSAFGSSYVANIPAQVAGTLVWYYIAVIDQQGNVAIRFPSTTSSYGFAVGYQAQIVDEMEQESGWTVGAPDDNATTGIWERADPEATDLGSQPEDDHTEQGVNCFVTDGRSGSSAGNFDVDNGKTTLFSPIYDLSAYQQPVIRYYKWYSNERGNAPFDDFWVVDISNDSGATWVSVENTNQPTDEWTLVQFLAEDFVTATDKVQLRFVAADNAPGSIVEACIDDFQVLSNTGGVTGIEDDPLSQPTRFAMAQNFPNPFNPSTTIRYSVPVVSNVKIAVYNTLGQEIMRLVAEQSQPGFHQLEWNGTNNNGEAVASGIYLYRIEATPLNDATAGFRQTRKLILLK